MIKKRPTDDPEKLEMRERAIGDERIDFLLEHIVDLADPNSEASRLLEEGRELLRESNGLDTSDSYEIIYNKITRYVGAVRQTGKFVGTKDQEYLQTELKRLKRDIILVGTE